MLNKLRRKSSRIISNNPALDDDDDEPMHGKGSSTSLSKGSSSRRFDRQSNPYSTTSSTKSGRSSSNSSRKSTKSNSSNRQRSSSLSKQLSSHARTAPPTKSQRNSSKGSSISWGGRTTETETDITQDNTTWNMKTPDCSDPSLVSDDDNSPNNHQYTTNSTPGGGKGGKQRELEASGLYSRRSTDGTSKNSGEDYTTNTTNSSGSGYQTNDESTSIGLNSSGTTQRSGLTSRSSGVGGGGSRSVGPLTDHEESGSVEDGDDSYSEESGIIFSSDVSKYSNMQRGMDDSKASYPSMGDNKITSLRGGGKNKQQQLQNQVRPPPRSMNSSSSASVGEHSRRSSAAASDKQRRSNSNPSTGSRQRSPSGGPASSQGGSRVSKSVSGNTINTHNSNNGEESMKLKPPSMKGMPYSQRSGISKKLSKNKPKKSTAEYDTSSASSPMYHSNAATADNGFNTSNQSITDSQRSGYESEQSETEVAAMQQLAYLVVSLRSELKEVNDSKDMLQSKLDTIESNGGNISVDSKIQQLQQDKVDLQADIDAFIAEQDDLKSEINELQVEKSSLNDMISRLKNPNGLSHSQSVGSFGNNSSNRSLGSKGKKTYEELQERITDITDENHKLEKEIQLLVNEKSQLVSTRNDRADEIGILEKQLVEVKETHDKEMKEKDMNIKSMKEKIQELESSFDIVEKESKESKMTIAVLEDELSAKNDELTKVQEDHTKVVEGESKKMTLLRSRLTQIEKQKGELQDINASLEKELDDIKNEQSSSNITAKQAEETVELQKKITSLEEEKTTLERELEDKDTELSALEGKLKDQQEASNASLSSEEKGEVKYLKERIANLATENDGLKTDLSTLQSQLTALEKDTTSTTKTDDEDLKVKQEEYEKLVSAKAELEAQNQESLDTITNLQKMVTSLEGTNTELEEEMNEATEAISMLEEELDRKDASAKLDLTKLTLLQQEISTANNEKTALVERNAKLSTTNDDLQTQIKVLYIEKKLAYEEAETLKLQKNIADEDQEEALLSRQEQKQEVDLLEDKMEAMREKTSEQLAELEQQVYHLEEIKSKLEVELEESSDAITVLREALTEMEEDKQEKDEQIKNLKTKLDDKEVRQKEHQVNVDTIATLQKMITSLESSKIDLEEELNTSSEELHDLRNRLKNKNTLKEVTDLEEKVAKYTDENKSLTKRIKELTEANDKMKCEVKDLGESLASVTATRALSEDSKASSSDPDLASCDALLSELKNQIKQIVSSRNEALHEVEVLREEASVVSSPSEAGKFPPSPEVEVKQAAKKAPLDDSTKTDAEQGDCDKTYKTHEKSVGTAPSKASSRGSSLLEAAKKLCDNLDKKKSQESNKSSSRNNSPIQAAAISKAEKHKVDKSKPNGVASREEVQDIKNVVDQDDDVSSAKEIKEVDKTPADVKPSSPLTPEEEKRRGNEPKLDIDQLTSIYFEKCGMSVSRFSDLSSDSSSFRRRAVKPPSDTITKKVKICRNGVFMGTYEGDLNPEGQRHGFGVLLCDNGNSYEGEWKKDKRDGLGIARYSSGDVYDGQWQRGKRQGHGVMYIEAGDTYIGSWNNGLKHGAGTYHWADGEVDVSWYQEDRRVGEGVRWNASRAKAFQLIRGTKKEELSLDEAYLRAEKLGLNLEKFDSQPGS